MPVSTRISSKLLEAAKGDGPADLLMTNVNLVNTLSGGIEACSVAVKDGIVLGFEEYRAEKVINAQGAYLCPGFIEAHIHVESTLLSPPEFARAAAGRGTATVVCDPHEIANVLGTEGIEYFLESTAHLPVRIYFMLPSCVPATHMETAGASLAANDLRELYYKYPDRFLGLGEMMNFPGVINQEPGVMAKLDMARSLTIDGHAPGLKGKELNTYILAGPRSDHECVSLEEAAEKLAKGMHVMIREGTSEHNLQDLIPLVNDHNWPSFSLVSDDRHPHDLVNLGHLDHNLRRAVALGIDPVRAVQLVTINPARYFGLKDRGAIAPGFVADMVLVRDLQDFEVIETYLQGKPLKTADFKSSQVPPGNSMHISGLSKTSFDIPAAGQKVRAIDILPGQIVTGKALVKPRIVEGLAQADVDNDLAKLAVVERHRASGSIGLGFVRGLGLKHGAIASTVAHDSHNLIIAGTNDADMLAAARAAQVMGGGLMVVQKGKVAASLALPIAGLMSDLPLDQVVEAMHSLDRACLDMGLDGNPFMILSFLALPVIPELKLTDQGLVDVSRFQVVGLWE